LSPRRIGYWQSVCFQLIRRKFKYGGDFLAFDHDHAVGISHNQIARAYGHAAALDRVIDQAGDKLGRAIGIRPDGVHRETQFANLVAIPRGRVQDDPCHALGPALVRHDRAHQGARLIRLAIDNDDIAGSGHRNCGMNHEVVSGANLDGQRRPAQAGSRIQRRHAAVHAAAAAIDIRQQRGGELRSTCYEVR
jgi:hypothetical protein